MIYEAQIPFVDGLNRPDDYVSNQGERPSDTFVVSRNRDGTALSLYADMTWDRAPYDPEGRSSTISFQFWGANSRDATPARLALADEIRWLTFVLAYLRQGPSLSNRTLQNYVFVMRDFARHCEISGQTIKEAIANTPSVLEFIVFAPDAATRIVSIMRLIWRLGEEVTGYLVAGRGALASLDQQAKAYRESIRQHPPMPTRIYAIVLERLQSEFELIVSAFDRVSSFFSEYMACPLFGLPKEKQRAKARKLNMSWVGYYPTFEDLLRKYELSEFWSRIGNARDRKGMLGVFVYVQMLCSLQIQAFTGMRRSEAQNLPLDCLEQVVRMGSARSIVRGRVTKLTRGKIKQARWVTSSRGKEAIELAQRLARLIYSAKESISGVQTSKLSSKYLFISPTYLWADKRAGKNIPSFLLNFSRFYSLKDMLEPIVESVDVAELVRIDPHRHWNLEEGCKVSEPWCFSTHQFRRSLALYAQKSGLVSLPTLKRQLQHVTQEMSLYYSRGSHQAGELSGSVDVTNLFKGEWLAAQPLSQYLSYANHVLSAAESELFGGHANWVIQSQRNKRSSIFENRETTLKQFKLGKLAFTVTPVGGCTNPGPCDRNPIDVLHINCVIENCKHLVGNVQKVERMIRVKRNQIESMEKLSKNLPEIVHEAAELNKLVAALEGIRTKPTDIDSHG